MKDRDRGRMRWLLVGGGGVLLWRVVAALSPHPDFDESLALRTTMALMGLLYVACGVWTFREARSDIAFVFALYGLATGLHWGGPLGVGQPRWDVPLLVFYLTFSSLAAQALELHLATAFPPSFWIARKRAILSLFYLPALLGAPVSVLLAAFGPESPAGSELTGAFGLLLAVGGLAGIAGFLVWILRGFTTPADERYRWRLWWVLGAVLVAFVPGLAYVAGLELGPADGWINLGFAPLPLALAAALGRPRVSSPATGRDTPGRA